MAATCNPFGAGKWRKEFAAYFKEKKLVILPDNDPPGRSHADQVATSLSKVVAEIKVIDLPGLAESGDVVDFIAVDEGDAAQRLVDQVRNAPPWQGNLSDKPVRAKFLSPAEFLAVSEEKVSWLVDGLLLTGGLSVIVAKPKAGKSTLARQLVVEVAHGGTFLGRETKRGTAYYLGLEDGRQLTADHLKRLGMTAADPIWIHTRSSEALTLRDLEVALQEQPVELIVIDSLFHFQPVKDVNSYSDVLKAFKPLMDLASRFKVHICVVHHLTKREPEDAFDAILGSTGILASVDTAIALIRKGNQRTIHTRQRYGTDLEQTVLIFDPLAGRSELGSSVQAIEIQAKHEKKNDQRNEISKYLQGHPHATEDEIKLHVTGKTAVIVKELRSMVETGAIERQGAGKKGDPYLYFNAAVHVEKTTFTGFEDFAGDASPAKVAA